MREIKFRAWDDKITKMSKPFSFAQILNFCNESGLGHMKSIGDYHKIMQFTGLKDKNGKEIYEGDICQRTEQLSVKYFKVNCQIEYKEDRFTLKWITKCFFNDSLRSHLEDLEVIGNIYENPELLS